MKLLIKRTHLIATVIFLIILLVCYLIYRFVIYSYLENRVTEELASKSVIETTDSLFKIHRVVIYDSAAPTTIDDTKNLENIDITLFSDIAIYLDNTSSIYDLTSQNTIKDLSITDISIESANSNNSYLGYKDYADFAKFTVLSNSENNDIKFNILLSNDDNNANDYSKPSFYTDCSNPITLGFVSNDIVTNYAITEDGSSISYNGKILKDANIDLSQISYTVNFTIILTTNSNEIFECPLTLNVNLNDEDQSLITNGYVYSNFTLSGDEYKFSKIVD